MHIDLHIQRQTAFLGALTDGREHPLPVVAQVAGKSPRQALLTARLLEARGLIALEKKPGANRLWCRLAES